MITDGSVSSFGRSPIQALPGPANIVANSGQSANFWFRLSRVYLEAAINAHEFSPPGTVILWMRVGNETGISIFQFNFYYRKVTISLDSDPLPATLRCDVSGSSGSQGAYISAPVNQGWRMIVCRFKYTSAEALVAISDVHSMDSAGANIYYSSLGFGSQVKLSFGAASVSSMVDIAAVQIYDEWLTATSLVALKAVFQVWSGTLQSYHMK